MTYPVPEPKKIHQERTPNPMRTTLFPFPYFDFYPPTRWFDRVGVGILQERYHTRPNIPMWTESKVERRVLWDIKPAPNAAITPQGQGPNFPSYAGRSCKYPNFERGAMQPGNKKYNTKIWPAGVSSNSPGVAWGACARTAERKSEGMNWIRSFELFEK